MARAGRHHCNAKLEYTSPRPASASGSLSASAHSGWKRSPVRPRARASASIDGDRSTASQRLSGQRLC